MNQAIAFALALLLLACACGDEDSSGDTHEHQHDDAAATQADAAVFEGCPATISPFMLGMSTVSSDGKIKAVLREASSVPPVRFLNDWTVAFTDALGSPLTDVNLREARAFMRVHGHYGSPDPRLTRRTSDPSVFELDALNLFMRGPWEVQLAVSSASAGDAALLFDVCVEE